MEKKRMILAKYQQYTSQLSEMLFLLTLALLPYNQHIVRPVYVAWLITYLISGRLLNIHNYQWGKNLLLPAGLALYFVWECLSLLWVGDYSVARSTLDIHQNFIYLLLISAAGLDVSYDAKRSRWVMICSAVLSVFVYTFAYYFVYNATAAIMHPTEFQHLDLVESGNGITLFMKYRSRYCNVLLIALALLPGLKEDMKRHWGTFRGRAMLILFALVLVGGIYLTYCRQAILALIVLVAYHAIQQIRHHRIWVDMAAITMAICGLAAVFTYHPRMENVKDDPRAITWQCATETPEDYLSHGLGAGGSVEYIGEKFRELGRFDFLEHDFNSPHNQYLRTLMELGLAGFIFFVLLWGTVFVGGKYWGYNQEYQMVILVFLLSMTTEDTFSVIENIILLLTIWAMLSLNDRRHPWNDQKVLLLDNTDLGQSNAE